MMPPATPNVVAGDARSPTKQTPTKEVEAVGDVVMLGEVSESSLLAGRATNTNSSPVKNSSPIKGKLCFLLYWLCFVLTILNSCF